MHKGFIPIKLKDYVKLHIENNPGTGEEEITAALRDALSAYKKGIRCQCGNPIWVIGSAITGYSCFTCITGEISPGEDYELDEALRLDRDD